MDVGGVRSGQSEGLLQTDPSPKKGICSKLPIPFSSDREAVSKGRKTFAAVVFAAGAGGAVAAGVLGAPVWAIAAIAVVTMLAVYCLLIGKKKLEAKPEGLPPGTLKVSLPEHVRQAASVVQSSDGDWDDSSPRVTLRGAAPLNPHQPNEVQKTREALTARGKELTPEALLALGSKKQ